MARITVEDCLEKLPNRFSLVLVSAERTKQLLRGAQPMVDNVDGNKEVVTALREIAAGEISVELGELEVQDEWLPVSQVPTRREPGPALLDDDDDLPPEA